MKPFYIIKDLRLFDALSLISITLFTFIFSLQFTGSIFRAYTFLYVVVLMFIYLVYGMSINNYFDWQNDADNKQKVKKNPIAYKKLSRNEGLLVSKSLLVSGIFLSFLWFPSMLVFYAAMMLNIFLYSYKFKPMPIMGLISHGLALCALFLFPAVLFGFDYAIIIAASVLIFFVSTVVQLENEISDYRPDRKAGLHTTAVKFGIKNSKKLYYISNAVCLLLLTALFFALHEMRLFIFFPLVVLSLFRLDNRFLRKNFGRLSLPYIFLSIVILILV